ncbi:MAG TPA: PAS domain-containing protein, partial [Gemmatimonas sp.]|nr:PAS domain-containing protein [Gemmatimonas sp.]
MAAALAQLAEGVILTDEHGRITFVNDAAARLHGVARLDVAPEAYADTYHLLTEEGEPFPSTELPLARAVLRGETVVDARWRIRRPDGSEIVAVGSARPVLGSAGEQLGAVLTVRDDTLRVEAEAARREVEGERARTAGFLEAMTDAHFVLDREFRFVSVNAASERTLMRTRDQLIGRVIWDAFPEAVGTAFESAYRRVVEEGVHVHFSSTFVDSVVDLMPEVDAYPTVDGGVAVFWRDIAPRVRAEAELRASEQRLRDVFEQAPVAVAVLSGPEHIYAVVSPMYGRTPGLERKLIGRSMREAFPEIAGTGDIEAMDEVYRTGVPFAATERAMTLTNGEGRSEQRFFNIGYQPLRDVSGRVYAVASVSYDVTDQVRARHDVEAAHAEAERLRVVAEGANAAKRDFLSTMSHELRTPLHAISGYTELLTLGLRGPLTEQQRQDLERIRRASQHLLALVTDVLNFARLDAGHLEYNVEDVEFATVLADLEPLIGQQLALKGISFDH